MKRKEEMFGNREKHEKEVFFIKDVKKRIESMKELEDIVKTENFMKICDFVGCGYPCNASILVYGTQKAGKSSTINFLLGKRASPAVPNLCTDFPIEFVGNFRLSQ